MKKVKNYENFNYYDLSECNDKISVHGLDGVKAGQVITFTVEVVVGTKPVLPGDGLMVGVPFGFALPQVTEPQREGYTTVNIPTGVSVQTRVDPKRERFAQVIIQTGQLDVGAKVVLIFGDRSKGCPGIRAPLQAFNQMLVPCCRKEENKLIATSPAVEMRANNFAALRCHLSPTFRQGKPVTLTIVAEDQYGNRLISFTGKIAVLNLSIGKKVPKIIEFTRKDRGNKKVTFIPNSDLPYFRVCTRYKGTEYLSNPSVKLPDDFPYNLYFGELHGHTEMSYDAGGTIEGYYKFARDTAVLDFAAVTDHQIGVKNLGGNTEGTKNIGRYGVHAAAVPFFLMCRMEPRWKYTLGKTKKFNNPGRFVTFPGFELAPSGLSGHRNLYYLEDYPEMLTAPEGWDGKTDILSGYIKNRKVLVIPHHPAIAWNAYVNRNSKGLVYSDISAEYQPVVEMYSKHGCSEYFGTRRPLRGEVVGYHAQDMLVLGHKFGFIAGADTHMGNPGSSMMQSGPFTTLQYRSGLIAVWAKELTRESLWDAIFARRVYATTYNKTVIWFTVNNIFMGNTGSIGYAQYPRKIVLRIHSAVKVVKYEILKNNEVIYAKCEHMIEPDFDIEVEDAAISGKPEDFYYARVTESEGDIVWSSPVWIANK
ncbi:MAG: DUF3604 domain-containing protein [Elusimicrobiota bacterium]